MTKLLAPIVALNGTVGNTSGIIENSFVTNANAIGVKK